MSDVEKSAIGPLSPRAESRPGLLRALGPGMAIAMVVGNVIGSGIFAKPGTIAGVGGSFGLIITAWITGGVLCILGALCFAELAVMLPRAGGMYVYLREAYGRPLAFLFGWSEFLFVKPASIGALAVASVTVFGDVIGHTLDIINETVLVLGLITGLAWINVLGVIWGGRFQALTTIIKSGLVGLLAVLPFLFMASGDGGIEPANYSSRLAAAASETPDAAYRETETAVVRTSASGEFAARFAAVLLAVMWTYNGWHGITPVAEEIRNPGRNIPLALFGGIGLLILLYVSVTFAYHGVLQMDEVSAAGKLVPQRMVKTLFGADQARLGELASAFVSAGVMCSMIGAMNSNVMSAPRVSFAMGRDDVFFRQLGRVHVNYRTPVTSIIVQSTMAGVLVISSGVLVTVLDGFRDKNVFDMLTDYVIFSASIFYMLAVASVFVLRARRPEWERPYRTLGYPLVPAAYLAFYSWFLYRILEDKPFEAGIGLVLIALGLPAYYAYRAWAVRNPEPLHDGM